MRRLLVVGALGACGTPAPPPPPKSRLPDPVTILMNRLDKDGDGRIVLAEFVDPMPGDILASFDKDGSGDLDREEVDDAMRHAPSSASGAAHAADKHKGGGSKGKGKGKGPRGNPQGPNGPSKGPGPAAPSAAGRTP